MTKKKSFWAEGIRFECQGSGQCCTSRGSYGYVYLTLDDRRRFARHFKITTRAFTLKYCAKEDGFFFLRNLKDDCEFLKENRCGVYEARPSQCRTWPFWPENMGAKAWKKDVVDFCPGVGKGRLHSAEEISTLLKS